VSTTVLEVLRKATDFFRARGLESARLDAEVLLAHGLRIKRLDLYLQHDRPLGEAELMPLRDLVRERGRGVPVAYLTGEKEFFALPFRVTKDVLVPRPETEGLVEAAMDALNGVANARFADVGTGSGCVAVALLKEQPDASAFATDVSESALVVARENATRHGVAERFDARHGPVLSPLRGDPAFGRLDAVLSNPPYIVHGDPTLDRAVAEHEPAVALYVEGDDPLSLAAAVATESLAALAPGGFLGIEIGADSGDRARALLERLGYSDVSVRLDGAGIPRIACGRRGRGT
jgi:release factor glutamine methyltransferase